MIYASRKRPSFRDLGPSRYLWIRCLSFQNSNPIYGPIFRSWWTWSSRCMPGSKRARSSINSKLVILRMIMRGAEDPRAIIAKDSCIPRPLRRESSIKSHQQSIIHSKSPETSCQISHLRRLKYPGTKSSTSILPTIRIKFLITTLKPSLRKKMSQPPLENTIRYTHLLCIRWKSLPSGKGSGQSNSKRKKQSRQDMKIRNIKLLRK